MINLKTVTLLLQPFGSKQSIPFVCLIHLFVGRCSLVVKDLHKHFSAEAYSLVFVEVEPLWPTKNMGHCPNTLDVGRAHKVGQAASVTGCLPSRFTISTILEGWTTAVFSIYPSLTWWRHWCCTVLDLRLCSSGTVQPQRGADRPGRRGGEGRVAAGAKGPPVHHAWRGRTDHGCLQPERHRSVAVCCLPSVVSPQSRGFPLSRWRKRVGSGGVLL